MKINKSYLFFVAILMVGAIINGCIESADRSENFSNESTNTVNIKKAINEFEEMWRAQYRKDHEEADQLDEKSENRFGIMNTDLEQLLGFFKEEERYVRDYYVLVSEVEDRCRKCSDRIETMNNETKNQDKVLEDIVSNYRKIESDLEIIKVNIANYKVKKRDLDNLRKEIDENVAKLKKENNIGLKLKDLKIFDEHVSKSIKVFGFIENLPSEKDLEVDKNIDDPLIVADKKNLKEKIIDHIKEVLYSGQYAANADSSLYSRKESANTRHNEADAKIVILRADMDAVDSKIEALKYDDGIAAYNQELIDIRRELEDKIEEKNIEQAQEFPNSANITLFNGEIVLLEGKQAAKVAEIATLEKNKRDLDNERVVVSNKIAAEERNDPFSYNNLKASYTKSAQNEYFESRRRLVKEELDLNQAILYIQESKRGIVEFNLVKSRLESLRNRTNDFPHLGKAHLFKIQEDLLNRAALALHREQGLLSTSLDEFDKQLKLSKNNIEVAKDISNFMAQVSEVIGNNEKFMKDPLKAGEIEKFKKNIINCKNVLQELNEVLSTVVPGTSNSLITMFVDVSCKVEKDASGNILNIGFVGNDSIKIYQDIDRKNSIKFKKRPYIFTPNTGSTVEDLSFTFGKDSKARSVKTEINSATGILKLIK